VTALLVGVFVASLVGSLHCAGMCGALATASCASCRTARRSLGAVAAYQSARGAAYASVGAIAGGIGGAIDLGGAVLGVQRFAGIVAGAAVILAGAAMLLRRRGVAVRPRVSATIEGAAPAKRLPQPRAVATGVRGAVKRVLDASIGAVMRLTNAVAARAGSIASPLLRAAAIGALSALLPCGWLWAFLAVAAGTASSTAGALVMTAFWAGSVPILSAIAFGAGRFGQLLRGRAGAVMGAVMIALGAHTAWTAAARGDALRLHRATSFRVASDIGELPSSARPTSDTLEARLRSAAGEIPACCREDAP